MNRDLLITELKRDEGVELKAYQDTVGIWTIGIGRNLQDVGVSMDEAEYMLANDIDVAVGELQRTFDWFEGLSDARQRVCVNMCFNLGLSRLLGFKKFIAAMAIGDWKTAGVEMLDSKWARQVGARSTRLRDLLLEG
jgi:lysozyme